jgi:hypothetical protein
MEVNKIIELVVGLAFISSVLFFLDSFIFKHHEIEKSVIGRFLAFCFLLILAGVICNQLLFNDSLVDETVVVRFVGFITFILTMLTGYYIGRYNK